MKPKFQFFEVVQLGLDSYSHNLEGTVLGMSRDEDGKWDYAVFLAEKEEVYMFSEESLI